MKSPFLLTHKLVFAGIFILLTPVYSLGKSLNRGERTFFQTESDTLVIIDTTISKNDTLPLDSININHVTDEVQSISVNQFDRLHTVRGETLIVKVKEMNVYEVVFNWPLNTLDEKLPKEEVLEIEYSDGRSELVKTKPAPADQTREWAVAITEKDWERVAIASEEKEVDGLHELGTVSARFEASKITATSDYLDKNAMIILRKKAARLGSNIVMVTDRKEYRAYGELPSIEISAAAYLKQ